MGLFGNNTKKLIQELRKKSEYYSNDLGKDIKEYHHDLKSDYEESSSVVAEFQDFVKELEQKLEKQDATKLEEFSKKLLKVSRNAKNGVEAMWELSRNQRKLTAQSLRDYEQFE